MYTHIYIIDLSPLLGVLRFAFQSSLCIFFFLILAALGLHCSPTAYRILVPQPGIKPTSPALEDGVLTTGLPRKSPSCL